LLGYAAGNPGAPSTLDSAGHLPRSLVVDPDFAWADGSPLRRRYSDTIIYEVHVKGFTMRHPGVPAELRGTYAGLAHEAAVGYLVDLGVTAVELLPVHQNVPEAFLPQRGLTNYWGYNAVGISARTGGSAAGGRRGPPGGRVPEFKPMGTPRPGAALEVLPAVFFTPPAEGAPLGPTLCFRGLDTPAYYRLDPGAPSRY